MVPPVDRYCLVGHNGWWDELLVLVYAFARIQLECLETFHCILSVELMDRGGSIIQVPGRTASRNLVINFP